MMANHQFTFEYTDDQLRIHHNEPPRFVAAINPESELSNIDIIEWIDAPEPDAFKLATLMRAAGEAYVRHEKAIQRDIRRAMDDLNDPNISK